MVTPGMARMIAEMLHKETRMIIETQEVLGMIMVERVEEVLVARGMTSLTKKTTMQTDRTAMATEETTRHTQIAAMNPGTDTEVRVMWVRCQVKGQEVRTERTGGQDGAEGAGAVAGVRGQRSMGTAQGRAGVSTIANPAEGSHRGRQRGRTGAGRVVALVTRVTRPRWRPVSCLHATTRIQVNICL